MWAGVQDQDIIPTFPTNVPLLTNWILLTAKIGQREVGKWLHHVRDGSIAAGLSKEEQTSLPREQKGILERLCIQPNPSAGIHGTHMLFLVDLWVNKFLPCSAFSVKTCWHDQVSQSPPPFLPF